MKDELEKNNSLQNNGQYSLNDGSISTLVQSKPYNDISINFKNSSIEEEIKIEDEIDKRIRVLQKTKAIPNYRELRDIVMEEMKKDLKIPRYKDCFNLHNNVITLIDIKQIRKAKEEDLEKKISEIKDSKMSHDEKLLKVLSDLNSSETCEYSENNKISQNQTLGQASSVIGSKLSQLKGKNEIMIPSTAKDKSLSNEDSTYDETGKSTSAETGIEIKHNFWIKYEYYDKSDFSKAKKGLKIQLLIDKDKEYKAFIYENDLNTYYFTVSQNLAKFYKIETVTPEKKEEVDKESGLYFCGKKIEQFNKICKANEMMCKDCMKKNKEIYHLVGQKHILININGRISSNSFSDSKFRCYGKFIVNKEIKNCIPNEFRCKACQELYKQKEYYLEEK